MDELVRRLRAHVVGPSIDTEEARQRAVEGLAEGLAWRSREKDHASELKQAADAIATLTAELAALKRQMIAVLVRDLGHDHAPLYGFAPIRHQFAWTMATDGLSAEDVAQRVEETKARAVDDGEPFVGYLDRRGRVSTLTAALEGLVASANNNMGSDSRFDDALAAARAALREVGRGC